ncbi:MAG TPA: aminotransferase class IV [Desulfobacteria bacterium]|nr:aminotransferase class IV [Desulfobacteria bacterium]
MNWVCIDGCFVPSDEAKISVFDHGFLYGDGLFETMRAYKGKIFALAEHLQRLRQGAAVLRLKIPFTDTELAKLLADTISRNNLPEAYIRLSFSRGSGPIGVDPALCLNGTLVIMAKAPADSTLVYEEGINLGICPVRRNHSLALPPAIKSMNFLNNILAKIWAKESGYAEALMLSAEGWVTETTVSNIFFIKAGQVFTPGERAGILAGVTKKYVIRVLSEMKIPCTEGLYSESELKKADEIFLTNSGSEVIPVVTLDGAQIGNGKPGELTGRIHRSLRLSIEKNIR